MDAGHMVLLAMRSIVRIGARAPPHHEGLSSVQSQRCRQSHAIRHQDRGRDPDDLEPWQKLNVASFLAGGIAAAFPECIGEPYGDGSGTKYLSLIGQPILIYGADRAALSRALERALARNVTPAVYTEDMFKTTHDAANREVVKAVIRAELNLVGLAMRAERKVIDKIVDGLKFHS
jgi:hypothetical protein